jgi:uncharacterized protein YoxC
MKKRITALLIVAAIIACLTGCVRYERGIEYSIFGSAKLYASYSMSEQFITSTYGSVEDYYKTSESDVPEGYTFEKFQEVGEDGSTWYGYKILTPGVSGSAIQDNLQRTMGDDFEVTYSASGFFTKNVDIKLVCNAEPTEGYESYGFIDEFCIKAGGPVLSSNGNPVDGKINSVKWDIAPLEFGDTTEMNLSISFLNPLALLIIGCILVIGIVVLVVLLVTNAKKKKAAAEAAANPFAGVQDQANGFVGEAQTQVNDFTAEVQADVAEAQAEVQADVQEAAAEVQADVAEAATEVKADVAEAQTEVAEAVEEVKTEE